MTAVVEPTPTAAVPPAPIPATLAERVLDLVVELVAAHDRRDRRAIALVETLLVATGRELPRLHVVEPRSFIADTVGAASYSIGTADGAVHLMLREAVGDHEAVVAFPPDVFARMLADGRAVLAWLASDSPAAGGAAGEVRR